MRIERKKKSSLEKVSWTFFNHASVVDLKVCLWWWGAGGGVGVVGGVGAGCVGVGGGGGVRSWCAG